MAAVAPAQLVARLESKDTTHEVSDVDAEGEDDVEMLYEANDASKSATNANVHGIGAQNEDEELEEEGRDTEHEGVEWEGNHSGSSEAEAEAEVGNADADADADGDDEEVVGAVKVPKDVEVESDAESEGSGSENGSGSGSNSGSDDEDGKDEDANDSDSSESDVSAGSGALEEWEDASTGEGEGAVAAATPNSCVFCKREEHESGEDGGELLSCAVCGDNAHRYCAQDGNSLQPDADAEDWRCPQCITNSLAPEDDKMSITRRLSTSSSRLTRDLLPAATRGASKPGSHSIFSTLIVEDDPLDGSRALRKRKSSSETREVQSRGSSKRRKRNSKGDGSSLSASSSIVDPNETQAGAAAASTTSQSGRETRVADKIKSNQLEPARPSRPRRQKPEAPRVRPLIRESQRLIIAIKVDLSQIKEKPPKKSRRLTVTSSGHARFGAPNTMHYSSPFYSLHDRETDESKIKPYGGILNETEADTSKTFPTPSDRARFEGARQKAEEEWKLKTAATEAEQETKGRSSAKISGPPSKIKCINFGGFEIDTWYAAPYPEEYSRNRVLYICEFCLKYMPSDYVAWRHKLKCPAKHPPGDEIYRDKSISIFEVDGRKNPVYCQNLCLLAKLFLGSKTLYYDVEPFLFYIMTEYDDLGYHFVGYFSKEKRPSSMNNVSCILTLPIHQRKGYGNLLIDFSYLLTRVEQKTGSPEKPLSDMGLVSYRNYWRLVLAYTFLDYTSDISINKISDLTGMTADDIIAALEALRALVRDPVTKTYALRLDRPFLKETIDKWESKGYVRLNPDALIWTPYIMGQYNLTNYDRGAISTVAPREDEDEQPPIPEEGVQQQIVASAEDAGPKMNGLSLGNTVDTSTLEPILEPSYTLAPDNALPLKIPEIAPPSSPKINGIHLAVPTTPVKASSPIPPTRYEIYPPIPGTISRRRTNKSGVRRSTYVPGSLSVRRNRSLNGTRSPRVNGISPRHITTPTSRKTRSALGKELEGARAEAAAKGPVSDTDGERRKYNNVDGNNENQDDEEEEEEEEERGGHAGGASQVNGQNVKASVADEDDDEDVDDEEEESDSDSEADADTNVEIDRRVKPGANGQDDDEDEEDEDEDEGEDEEDEGQDDEDDADPEAEAEAELELSAGEDDEDFEPDGEVDAEADEDEDEEPEVRARVHEEDEDDDDDEEDGEVDSEDVGGEDDEEEDEDDEAEIDTKAAADELSEDEEDAEGESDHGDDVAMVDA